MNKEELKEAKRKALKNAFKYSIGVMSILTLMSLIVSILAMIIFGIRSYAALVFIAICTLVIARPIAQQIYDGYIEEKKYNESGDNENSEKHEETDSTCK